MSEAPKADVIETDVIIVGAGIVGLTLSCILGKSDIENMVLEKNLTTSDWPEANYINPRSMELLHQKELDQYIRADALPENFMAADCVSLTKEPPLGVATFSEEFVEKTQSNADGTTEAVLQEIPSQKPCRIPQVQTEAALKKTAEELSSCSLRYGWEVTSISQNEDGVKAEVVLIDSGERKTIEALYLVGCDGAESMVRRSLGIKYVGDFDVAKFRTIFFESRELRKRLYNPEFMAYLMNGYDFRAIILPVDTEQLFVSHVMLTPGEKTREKSAEYYVKSFLDNSGDIPFKVLQDNSWKAHIVHVETFQEERMFLAGDSAHLVVPVGGIGMNSGIGDAFNLGWKLVATLQGWGGEWLLDSYASESLPFYKKVIDVNGKRFRFLESPSKTTMFLMSTAPFKYAFRAISKLICSRTTVENEDLVYGFMLRNTPICIPSGLMDSAIEDREYYVGEAYSACRAPHFRFEDGSSLFSKLGEMFTLLCLSQPSETGQFLEKYAREAGLPLKVLHFDNDDLRKLYKAKMVLIRPDLYIAWCGDEVPPLSEDDSLRARARVLINVVSGATPLPLEWGWEQVKRIPPKTLKSKWYCMDLAVWIIPICSVLIGVAALVGFNTIMQQ